jgi:hypothetical protein
MACALSIRGLRIPLQHGELRTVALNYKPMNGIAANGSANLAAKLLEKGHFFVASMSGLLKGLV